jgi:predicted Zn-dependent protease
MPSVSWQEQQAIEAATPPLDASALATLLRRNYYLIAFRELAVSTESAEEYSARMIANEATLPWSVFASVTQEQLQLFARQNPGETSAAAIQAVAVAQAPLQWRVARVGSAVATYAGRSDVTFLLDPRVGLNAAAAPGGQILVGPQLVMLAGSDDALAFVLGHELAHIVNGHLQAKATQSAIVQTVAIVAALAAAADCQRNPNCMPPAAAAALSGLATQGAIEATGYNRDMEREADYQGLHYAAGAGYRAEAAGDFLQEMLAVDYGAGRSFSIPFLATHPADAERVGHISKWLMSEFPLAEPCWQVAARDNRTCTTCCAAGRCTSTCSKAGAR